MKKIIIKLFITILLVSCGNTKDQGVIEETGEIIEGYADTLEGSIGDAKAVKALIEGNQQNLKDNLDGIY